MEDKQKLFLGFILLLILLSFTSPVNAVITSTEVDVAWEITYNSVLDARATNRNPTYATINIRGPVSGMTAYSTLNINYLTAQEANLSFDIGWNGNNYPGGGQVNAIAPNGTCPACEFYYTEAKIRYHADTSSMKISWNFDVLGNAGQLPIMLLEGGWNQWLVIGHPTFYSPGHYQGEQVFNVTPGRDYNFRIWIRSQYAGNIGPLWNRLVGNISIDYNGGSFGSIYYRDADGDGYGNSSQITYAISCPAGYVTNGSDCNDGNASIHPGTPEICNGVDDDCDGSIDEGVRSTYYRDADGDGYGNSGNTTQACSCPSGYVGNASDCNDGSASIHPGATEVLCNGIDENCNGLSDDDKNSDGDPVSYCSGDCDDNDPNRYPGNTEVCSDGVDNDCDGTPDDGCGDLDGDGEIDRDDLNIILSHRNQPASACPPCDLDGDGTITVLDSRILVNNCTCAGCVCP